MLQMVFDFIMLHTGNYEATVSIRVEALQKLNEVSGASHVYLMQCGWDLERL